MTVVEITHWSDIAACRGVSLSLFFDHDGETPTERDEREAKAKAICAGCHVFNLCRAEVDARPANFRFGVFAGENERERSNRHRRERRRRCAS